MPDVQVCQILGDAQPMLCFPVNMLLRLVVPASRARLAEVFAERKQLHKGIASTMPNGILGQDFAIQHLQVTT